MKSVKIMCVRSQLYDASFYGCNPLIDLVFQGETDFNNKSEISRLILDKV